MNKRLIKTHELTTINENSKILHPITGELLKTKVGSDPICITKFKLNSDKKINTLDYYKCVNNIENYNKYMHIPAIGILSYDLLEMYEITNDIESIDKWINYMIKKYSRPNYFTLNRVINAWVKNNFDTLKDFNNILEKIYFNLVLIYLDDNIKSKVKDDSTYESKNIKKDISKYIDYWFSIKNPNDFDLDLLTDILTHLNLKYSGKSNNKKYKKYLK